MTPTICGGIDPMSGKLWEMGVLGHVMGAGGGGGLRHK
jgi:hypothetical protein